MCNSGGLARTVVLLQPPEDQRLSISAQHAVALANLQALRPEDEIHEELQDIIVQQDVGLQAKDWRSVNSWLESVGGSGHRITRVNSTSNLSR